MPRAAWLVVLLVAAPARAQDHNRQAFPVGEEAVGMGGAYTGRADDASAAYYNPGGLPLGHRGSVGVNLSISVLDRYRVGAFDPESTALDYRDALGVPFYAGGSIQFEAAGLRHGLAFATFSPSNINRLFISAAQDGDETRTLHVHRQDRTRWYGVSYGLSPIPQLGFGASAFLAVRDLRHEEEEIVAEGTRSVYTRISEVDFDAELLVFRVGALWQPHPTFSLGLMVQPPAVVIGGRADVSGVSSGSDGVSGVDTRFFSRRMGADSPLPFQARLGASWHPTEAFVLNADVIVEGPLGSASDPIERLRVDPDEPAILGAFFATRYHDDWVADFAVGGRGVVEGVVPISAGFFTSFSAAPPFDGVPDTYRPDRVHILGGAIGVGILTEDVDFTIGVVGAFGFGQGMAVSPFSDLGAPTYGLADVSSQTLFLYFVGAGGAATAIGREVAEEFLGIDDDEVEGDEDADTEADAGADSNGEAGASSDGEADAEADAGADADASPEPDADTAPGADAEADEAPDANPDPDPDAGPEPDDPPESPDEAPGADTDEAPPPTQLPEPDPLDPAPRVGARRMGLSASGLSASARSARGSPRRRRPRPA